MPLSAAAPAGLAAALLLNRRGHSVTVYERSDRPGGLLRYGIPNMKLEKSVIDRRIHLMEQAGVRFVCGTDIGKDLTGEELLSRYDRVLLACGASQPRDLDVPGRESKGIHFAVEFLSHVTKTLLDSDFSKLPNEDVKGKQVLVIGGGDTGNDCVGTAVRLGAAGVVQLEMMPQPPAERLPSNPWPEWPRVGKTDYGQEEAAAVFGSDPRRYQTTVKEFLADENGSVRAAVLISLRPEKDEATGRLRMVPVEGSEEEIPADLVLIAAGFNRLRGLLRRYLWRDDQCPRQCGRRLRFLRHQHSARVCGGRHAARPVACGLGHRGGRGRRESDRRIPDGVHQPVTIS